MFERSKIGQDELLEIGQALGEDIERVEKQRIQIEAFRGVKHFTDEEIDSDLDFVKRKKALYDKREANDPDEFKKVQEKAHIIELVLPMAIHDYDWLGKNTNIVYTSPYDDIQNRVDSVAQLMEPGETRNLGMEIDFTSSEPEMADKIRRIGAEIEEGKITKVKYFDSPATGKLKNLKMPKIVFGVPMNEATDLADLLVQARKDPKSESVRKAIENHAVKKKFLEYVANQLSEFGRMAAEAGNIPHAVLHHNVLEAMRKRGLIK
jgi:methylglyoxal synthase